MYLLKELFQKALRSNFAFAKTYHQLRILIDNPSAEKQPLIIHQMGKVASTSIYESLKELSVDNCHVYHTHFLSDAGFDNSERFYRENFHRIKAVHAELIQSFYLRKYLRRPNKKKVKIITLIRDPVAKNVSSFFQNLEYLFDFSIKKKLQVDSLEYILAQLKSLFLEQFPGHRVPIDWFDSEIKPVFNIDVYQTSFSTARGYQIYKSDFADVLLLKLEQLDEILKDALKEFLNINDFELKAENIGDNKKYAQVYKSFKDLISLPDSYLEKMYSSKYAQHFYTSEELTSFRLKWHSGSN